MKGDVNCNRCGQYLGNYMNDDYFKLIKLKYCPQCKEAADVERKRLWQREHRINQKKETENLKKYSQELQIENEKLRQQIAELRSRLGE